MSHGQSEWAGGSVGFMSYVSKLNRQIRAGKDHSNEVEDDERAVPNQELIVCSPALNNM